MAHADDARHLELVREMLRLTDVKGTLEKTRLDNVELVRTMVAKQKGPDSENPIMKRLIARMMEKYETYSKEIFDYEKKEAAYIEFYKALLSEHELEEIVAFYRTDGGRALVRVQPQLLAKMQHEAAGKFGGTEDRVNAIMKETVEEIEAELTKESKLP